MISIHYYSHRETGSCIALTAATATARPDLGRSLLPSLPTLRTLGVEIQTHALWHRVIPNENR